MPAIDLSILNQRQTPAFYADVLANRPAAGFIGRIFVSTDTFAFYRDNGTTWDLIGGPGTGTITGSGANGQVSYWNGASTITGSNDLFFDAVNGHLGIGTITPGTALGIDHDQSTLIQLQQTVATNDNRIAFLNNGVGLWRIGSFYNAGANDFGVYDVVGAAQPVTIKKTTGQVLIGTSTVGSGKLVVASATSDNGIQIVGATAPSLRIDSAESGPTKRIGLGLATGVNNFIQGSADRDFCMFNGSTTASPILFGIYDTTNVQEAARISAARNFLIGTATDSGEKLIVSGIGKFTSRLLVNNATDDTLSALQVAGNISLGKFNINTSRFIGLSNGGGGFGDSSGANIEFTSPSGTSNGINFYTYNGTTYSAKLQIASSGAATFSSTIDTSGDITITKSSAASFIANNTSINGKSYRLFSADSGQFIIQNTGVSDLIALTSGGNLLIGTTTDAGQKLQVAGITKSDGYQTGEGTAILTAVNTPVTIITLPNNNARLIQVYAYQIGGGASQTSTISYLQEGSTLTSFNSGGGGFLQFLVSSNNIRIQRIFGGTYPLTINFKYIIIE